MQKKKTLIVITDEKDKCIICNRKIYKDKFVTKTKDGFICYKCKKFKKGEIYLIKEFQEFGRVLIQLENKLTKNIEGGKLKIPLWEGFILDAEDEEFRYYIQEKNYLSLCYEGELIPIKEVKPNSSHD